MQNWLGLAPGISGPADRRDDCWDALEHSSDHCGRLSLLGRRPGLRYEEVYVLENIPLRRLAERVLPEDRLRHCREQPREFLTPHAALDPIQASIDAIDLTGVDHPDRAAIHLDVVKVHVSAMHHRRGLRHVQSASNRPEPGDRFHVSL